MFENNEFFFFFKKNKFWKLKHMAFEEAMQGHIGVGLGDWQCGWEIELKWAPAQQLHPIDESNITRFRRTAFRESCLGIISQRSTYPQQWPHGWLHKGTQTLANKNFFIIVNVLNTKYHTFVIWKIKNVNIFPGNFFFFIFRWNIFVVEDCYIIHN